MLHSQYDTKGKPCVLGMTLCQFANVHPLSISSLKGEMTLIASLRFAPQNDSHGCSTFTA
jgi:hypothetical protein